MIERGMAPIWSFSKTRHAVSVFWSVELWLAADKRRLASFESETTAFTRAGLLTFGTATAGGTATGTVAAGYATTAVSRTSVRREFMEHKKAKESDAEGSEAPEQNVLEKRVPCGRVGYKETSPA